MARLRASVTIKNVQPKEVTFIQCGCEKGKLKEIVSTKISWGSACGDGGEQTIFFECDHCCGIFERTRSISGSYLGNDPDCFSRFRKYAGKLTKEELIEFAPKHFGNVYEWDEKKIIRQRES